MTVVRRERASGPPSGPSRNRRSRTAQRRARTPAMAKRSSAHRLGVTSVHGARRKLPETRIEPCPSGVVTGSRREMDGCSVPETSSSGSRRSSWSFSPGRMPRSRSGMSTPTRPPDNWIMRWARSMMGTGSPISSMKMSPALRQQRRLEHELHRLLDAHEEAGHAGIGHRDRAAGLDLPGEGRDDAAPAPEHVAEPDGGVGAALLRRSAQQHLLGHPLRGAHDARGLAPPCRIEISTKRCTPTAADASMTLSVPNTLVTSGLDRVVFEHGNMLVGRRVEHDVGPVPLEHLEERVAVVDVDKSLVARTGSQDDGVSWRWVSSWSSRTSLVGPKPATWRQISEPMEPPAPVTSTRVTFERPANPLEVGRDRGAPQEVLDAWLAGPPDGEHASSRPLTTSVHRGEHLHGDPGRFRRAQHVGDHLRRGLREWRGAPLGA